MSKENRQFRDGLQLARLTGTYPAAEDMLAAAALGSRQKAILARLWISEGIPFAFRECPGLYEEARSWLAEGLQVDAKLISIAGSGRLGYSLTPRRWGESYRPASSDLDFFGVSAALFKKLRQDFERWTVDYNHGAIQPSSDSERSHWESNQSETPTNLGRGFIDSWRVPNYPEYPAFLTMNRRLYALTRMLRETDGGPNPSKNLGLRCYRDWPSYERQLKVNLGVAVSRNRT